MIHKPIHIKNLALSLPHKTCFDNFNSQISYGSRIAIIGRNGSGKTTLLKMLNGLMEPTSGTIQCGSDIVFGFVPQIIEDFDSLSGAQRLNKTVTQALSLDPNVLTLDEPTNHLDSNNRKSLMRMLKSYQGTLIIVSHDTELLRHCIDTLWHIEDGKIHVFSGNYDDYIAEAHKSRASIEQELSHLDKQRKDCHEKLMKEQMRAAKSKASGEKKVANRKWLKMVGDLKGMKAEKSQGEKLKAIDGTKKELSEQLNSLRLPEIITPRFSISTAGISDRTILSISDGCIGYAGKEPLLQNINLSIGSKDRIAIQGDNASGKSTLIKGILDDASVIKSGSWTIPKLGCIGYLDQHYGTLSSQNTVYETIAELVPTWTQIEVRRHLNDFLFRKNEEVNAKVQTLSGGEKARLSLAAIAALTPRLLILDEITNNLDLETRNHVAIVLKQYPGAMIVISHDADFLKEIGINHWYKIVDGLLDEH